MGVFDKKQYLKEYQAKHRERLLAYYREWYSKNKDRASALSKKWVEQNKEKVAAYQKEYRKQNRQAIRAKKNEYKKKRWREDPQYRISQLVSHASRRLVKYGWSKNGKTLKRIGCSYAELKRHIESQWKPGMSWENHGFNGWHIDHIRPLATFDLSKESEVNAAMHYTNLQPLWAAENLKKGKAHNA